MIIPNYTYFKFIPNNPELSWVNGEIIEIDDSDFHSVIIHLSHHKKIRVNKVLLFAFPERCTAHLVDNKDTYIYGFLSVSFKPFN